MAWSANTLLPRNSLSSDKMLDCMMGAGASWRERALLPRTPSHSSAEKTWLFLSGHRAFVPVTIGMGTQLPTPHCGSCGQTVALSRLLSARARWDRERLRAPGAPRPRQDLHGLSRLSSAHTHPPRSISTGVSGGECEEAGLPVPPGPFQF